MPPGPELVSPMQTPFNLAAPPPPGPFTMPMPVQYPPPGQGHLQPCPSRHGTSSAPTTTNDACAPAKWLPSVNFAGYSSHSEPTRTAANRPRHTLKQHCPRRLFNRAENGIAHHLPPAPQPDGFTQANRAPPRDGFGHARRGSMRRNSTARPKPPCAFFPQGRCRNG